MKFRLRFCISIPFNYQKKNSLHLHIICLHNLIAKILEFPHLMLEVKPTIIGLKLLFLLPKKFKKD